jgi:hypothetical protein
MAIACTSYGGGGGIIIVRENLVDEPSKEWKIELKYSYVLYRL